MRFKNKLYKNIERYTKEIGKFNAFKKAIIHYTIELGLDIYAIKYPYELLEVIGMKEHWNYMMYMHKNNFEEHKKMFENFLDNKGLKEIFMHNIRRDFIIKEIQYENIEIVQCKNDSEFLYNNVPPTDFIIYTFSWEFSEIPSNIHLDKDEFDFWSDINDEWINVFSNYIKEKYL